MECCNRLFCFNRTCYCIGMVSVTSASRYMCDSPELSETVPIGPEDFEFEYNSVQILMVQNYISIQRGNKNKISRIFFTILDFS